MSAHSAQYFLIFVFLFFKALKFCLADAKLWEQIQITAAVYINGNMCASELTCNHLRKAIKSIKSTEEAPPFQEEQNADPLDVGPPRPGGAEGCWGGGGLRWSCMAALSPCIFDIWPKPRDGMKERAGKGEEDKKRSVCLFRVWLNIQRVQMK